MPAVRVRARVQGTVQGVGFRPFVYRLAAEEGLGGWVLNDDHGVLLEVEGPAESVERFQMRLRSEPPPLASIDRVTFESLPPAGGEGFAIRTSEHSGTPDALITPDTATCADCLAELADPGDRRHRYPFINCTNCGPRFTIVRGVPYDRPLTTMARFPMCEDCRREYEDPADRRFHAQPNACPVCGPSVGVLDREGRPEPLAGAGDAIELTAGRLAAGAIAAVKGLGGFHLVCDAADQDAVAALRARKHREDKPFALMVATVAQAGLLIETDPGARALLSGAERPIVLGRRRPGAPVASAVAPRAPELGVMLPYTPLHHLLLADFNARRPGAGALVMTSGNLSDEPIAFRDEDALARLAGIADLFLLHDREIETRTDDSVVRMVQVPAGPQRLTLRRSRGYVPAPLSLPVPAQRPLLACGAEQKNTFCVARGGRAWVGHHIGDLEDFATLEAFRHGVGHFERMFAVEPELLVCDLHPDYLSTRYAVDRADVAGLEVICVQHHHAHLAGTLAEHGRTGPAVGAIFDGTGYGEDHTIWGGELLVGDLTGYERAGHLWPVPMPGGAAAVRQPWRMACSWLIAAFGHPHPPSPALAALVDRRRWETMATVATSPAVSPQTSSMGRLFDAVGALCGLAPEVTYEGQAAVELEAAAAGARPAAAGGRWAGAAARPGATGRRRAGAAARPGAAGGRRERVYMIDVVPGDHGVILDPRQAVRAIVTDLERGTAVSDVAAGFHDAVARATADALVTVATDHGLRTLVAGGGVFQNRLLLENLAGRLAVTGNELLVSQQLPPGDGGISFGQAAVAAARGRA